MSQFEQYSQLLAEMPQTVSNVRGELLDDRAENYSIAQDIVANADKQMSITFAGRQISLYTSALDGRRVHTWLSDDMFVVAEFVLHKRDRGVKFSGAWNHVSYRGVARFLMLNYYLKQYEFIESDNTHTAYGKKYWQKLIESVPSSDVVVINPATGTEQPFSSLLPGDIWGDSKDFYWKAIRIYRNIPR